MTVIESLKRMGVTTSRLCLDSRRVRRGDVFVACPGVCSDGRQFIGDAINRGAAAIIYEADGARSVHMSVPNVAVVGLGSMLGEIADLVYGHPSSKLHMIGVTGTNGKTTVSQWIAQALNILGRRCAIMGTLGNGFPGQLKESPNTTPDAVTVHGGLAVFLAQGAAACAMEVSSIGLDQGRVNGVSFDTAVLTNLTRDHLDYHGDMAAYAGAKAKLFATPGLKAAVLNLDDRFGVEVAALLRGHVKTIGYTMNAANGSDVVLDAKNIRMDGAGVEFAVDARIVRASVIGRFNVANLLAVYGALQALGIEAEQAVKAMAALTPPPGRLQTAAGSEKPGNPLVVVDYAHTPDALEKALASLRENALARGGKLICVFGCGGDRDPGKRPLMGAVAESLADQVFVTSDNPRSEDAAAIACQITAGMRRVPAVELDRAAAIRLAIAAAEPRDVILIAGKGHESYQEVAGIKHPFSDIGMAQLALEHGK